MRVTARRVEYHCFSCCAIDANVARPQVAVDDDGARWGLDIVQQQGDGAARKRGVSLHTLTARPGIMVLLPLNTLGLARVDTTG